MLEPRLTPKCSSASPFWRTPQRETPPARKTRDSGLVVGAAYSHADMLKFDSLYATTCKVASLADLLGSGTFPTPDHARGPHLRHHRPEAPQRPRLQTRRARGSDHPLSKHMQASFPTQMMIGILKNPMSCTTTRTTETMAMTSGSLAYLT